MDAIEVSTVSKEYESIRALDELSFSVGNGKLFGIIGADGAGKTTLMRILATLLDYDNGSIKVLGHSSKEIAWIRSHIGYMPQRFSLYQDLSVRENLEFFAAIFGVPSRERPIKMKKLLEFSRLLRFQNRRAGQLSGGMKQKLALSCALIHTPELIILDEPTTGVDPVSRNEFWDILKEIVRGGVSVIVSTPYMDEANICDELLILHKGKKLVQGTPKTLLDSYPLKLFSVSAPRQLNWPPKKSPPAPITMIYPSGGNLYVASDSAECSADIINGLLAGLSPQIVVEQIEPSIEDLFYYLLKGSE